jgi:hypothetical protein
MAGLVRSMAMAIRFSAATLNGGNGAAAKVTQLQDLRQYTGALLFEAGKEIRQGHLLS